MPYILVETVRPTKEQKEKLISELTRVASEILGIKQERFYCLIKENKADNWGVGGKVLSEILREEND